MIDQRPSYLHQGEQARLFPVLSMTSKEGRTTSIVLASLTKVRQLGAALLATVDQRVGKSAEVSAFTEVVFKKQKKDTKDRPDGMIVLRVGKREWKALIEAKVGSNQLDEGQIERYRAIAKDNDIDCVITLSNQFATSPLHHPIASVRKNRSKIPVYHWSWMKILTTADLLISQGSVKDDNQLYLLNELRRFLSHESAGVTGFDRMPSEWSSINKLVSSGGTIPTKSNDALVVIEAWHQETKDLSLILSRLTKAHVTERLGRKYAKNPSLRLKDGLTLMRENTQLHSLFDIPNAAAPLEITADMARRSFDIGMTLRAPEDKVSSKARLNWLLRQIKTTDVENIFIRLKWQGMREDTQFSLSALQEDTSIIDEDKSHLTVRSFHVFMSIRAGVRFTQLANFIVDLEKYVPGFYDKVGSKLSVWKKPAPQIKPDRASASDVTMDAISEEADSFET
ncbi:MAG: hypothetical protein COA60_005070 [Robiginitomaculum sp.]|nr:hypothetical protein [Robiginitomaculum sp.]